MCCSNHLQARRFFRQSWCFQLFEHNRCKIVHINKIIKSVYGDLPKPQMRMLQQQFIVWNDKENLSGHWCSLPFCGPTPHWNKSFSFLPIKSTNLFVQPSHKSKHSCNQRVAARLGCQLDLVLLNQQDFKPGSRRYIWKSHPRAEVKAEKSLLK